MADWTRDTPWRQGSLVARDDLRAIGVSVEEQHVCGLVISHDCDLANDRLDHEPWVELVLLEPLGKLDASLAGLPISPAGVARCLDEAHRAYVGLLTRPE
ncbi:hypothetical protein [Alloalcanivorax profundimaris]|jgi:hypothetical protein|uniref:hypothetical protein n=1 Tax=Alloalcanivorax profundimaris TaxID=2735259 RepID=UPI001891B4CC|nr:hypothetical protein [Alloalcanivorax profundimaris]